MSIDAIIGDGGSFDTPVCAQCMVLYQFRHSYGWECPICRHNSDDKLWHSSCGISDEELEGNFIFLKFMQGPAADIEYKTWD